MKQFENLYKDLFGGMVNKYGGRYYERPLYRIEDFRVRAPEDAGNGYSRDIKEMEWIHIDNSDLKDIAEDEIDIMRSLGDIMDLDGDLAKHNIKTQAAMRFSPEGKDIEDSYMKENWSPVLKLGEKWYKDAKQCPLFERVEKTC
jgi:hypothetical protein